MKKSRGTRIAEARREKAMTQAQLAEQMGVTDKAVSKWERDLSCPDVETLPRLAEVLEIPLEQLLGSEKQTKPQAEKTEEILNLVLKAIPLAMGVAVAVLAQLGKLDNRSGFTMVGLGLAALALGLLREKQ